MSHITGEDPRDPKAVRERRKAHYSPAPKPDEKGKARETKQDGAAS